MGQPISTQHPAVALRSHFNAVRAMLVVAVIAVIGLTAAVVILATDDQQQVTGVSRSAPAGQLNYGGSGPSESRIAEAIGSGAGSPSTGGPDESTVARAVSGR
jgi:hypothetical protein